ncbi:MAG TPA: glycosyltransferase family 87 protein [Patescibacteria group bacterium]|nr:glycosyltransferase family 87 protein [Patescibacteria group bacterium]
MKKILFWTLLVLNSVLLIKLRHFLPIVLGKNTLLDFDTYFRLTNDIKLGVNPYTVNYMTSLGPPSVYIFFYPFSFLPLTIARSVFSIINISFGILTLVILSSKLFPKNRLLAFLIMFMVFFSSFPIRFSIEIGQPNLVIGCLLALLICYPKNKYLNIILSLATIIKTNYLIALVSFVKSNIKLVFKTVITSVFLIVILFPVVKPSFYSYYIRNIQNNLLPKISKSESTDYYNQSIPARLNVLGVGEFSTSIYIILFLVIIFLIYKSGNVLLGILASIILSPIAWQHYFAALFPVFVVVFKKVGKSIAGRIFLISAYLFWWIEFPFLHQEKINIFTAILSSHYIISVIILFYLIRKHKIITTSATK